MKSAALVAKTPSVTEIDSPTAKEYVLEAIPDSELIPSTSTTQPTGLVVSCTVTVPDVLPVFAILIIVEPLLPTTILPYGVILSYCVSKSSTFASRESTLLPPMLPPLTSHAVL